ncbi:MAG: hypothetical protein JW940_26970 [Polyangiaceae bacterium]|nr:hypothetical protein [Polyangiaceae bacterium]
MISKTLFPSLCIVLGLACVACSSSEPGEEGPTNGSGGGNNVDGGCASNGYVAASATYNFSFWSVVELPNLTQVKPGSDLSFDWSAVTIDFLTKPMDPAADIILATVALWEITPEQFATQINDDTLGTPAVAAFLKPEGRRTATRLFEMEPPAGPIPQEQMLSFFDIDVYPPGNNFYTFIVGSDLTPGKKSRMIAGFELNAETENTQVILDNNSTHLDYGVDFSRSQPTLIPAGTADITVDWSGMETTSRSETDPGKLNAAGLPFMKRSITQVRVGRYTQTEDELKQREAVLKIDDLADATFTGSVESGATLNLSTLKDPNGNAFTGIDSSHTWILALINTDSNNPAPWYLTFLHACD